MKLYSVNELKERYPEKPSNTTIYKYFKLEELKPYIVEEDGKKLREDGLEVLDRIRAKKEKYRPKFDNTTVQHQETNINNKEDNAYKIEYSGLDASDIKDLVISLKDQLRIKDEQLKEKDQQIKELHQILYNATNTITLQNGTIAMQNGTLKAGDPKETITPIEVKETEIEIKETPIAKETIIKKSADAPTKKSFFNIFKRK